MTWKGFERSVHGPIEYYPNICMEGLRKITKNLSQDSRYPSQDSNEASPEYKPTALLLDQPIRFDRVINLHVCADKFQ
jgi:hypothetical protein